MRRYFKWIIEKRHSSY